MIKNNQIIDKWYPQSSPTKNIFILEEQYKKAIDNQNSWIKEQIYEKIKTSKEIMKWLQINCEKEKILNLYQKLNGFVNKINTNQNINKNEFIIYDKEISQILEELQDYKNNKIN